MGSRQLSSRFTGSRWVILLNGFYTIVQQIFTGSRRVILLNGFQTIIQQIHRESPGYSSQRLLDYCSVDSLGVAGLFFSTGSRLLSSRYSQGVADYSSQQFLDYWQIEIHRESLGFFSQRILDYCRVDSQGAAGLFFSMGSRQLSSRFTGSPWVILLNGFLTIVQQIFTGSRWVILLNGFQTIVQQIHRESPGYSSQRVLDYCSVDLLGVAGLFFSTGSRLLYSRFSVSRWVILLNGFQTIVQQIFTGSRCVFLLNGFQTIVLQIHWESLGYSSQRVLDYYQVDSQGVAGLFCTTGSRLLSSRFTGSRWVILLNGFLTIVQQIHRKSLGYSSQRVPDYCPVDIHRESLCYSSQRVLDYCPVDSQGVAGLFFSTGSRLLSSSYSQGVAGLFFSTGSRLLSVDAQGVAGYSSQRFLDYCLEIHREALGYSSQRRLDVQQIHRESLGYSSQRVVDYCPVDIHSELLGYSSQLVLDYCKVDAQGVAGLFFSCSRFLDYCPVEIHREALGYSSQRRLDYCSRQQRFTGSRRVILLSGFQTIVQQIHREPLGYSSQWVQDNCPVDSQGVAGLFFSTGSRLLSSRFTGNPSVILLNGFIKQIHSESLGYSARRVQDYCPVDSQGVTGYFFSTVILLNGLQTIVQQISTVSCWVILLNWFQTIVRFTGSRWVRFTGSRWVILLNGFKTIVQIKRCSRLLSSRFRGSRLVILFNGLQTIVQQIHREPLGYFSQWVQDNCPIDEQGVAGLFFSTDSRLLSSRYSQGVAGLSFSTGSRLLSVDSQGVAGLFFSAGSRLLFSRFTGSRWVILLNGFKTIVQQIHRESLDYSSQRVLDYCPVDSQAIPRLFFSTGSRLLSSRFTVSRWVILHDGFKTIVQQIHRESLGISSQRVLDYCPVDSQGVAGLFFSTVSTLLSSRFTGSRWVILLNGLQTIVQQISTVSCWVILLNWFQTIVKQIHRESLGYSSKRVQDYCPVDSEGVAWLYSSTGCRLLSSRFTGSRWVIFLNGFKTIVQQMNRESLGYSSQRILDYCPVDIHRESLGYSSQRVLDYCQQIHRESPGYSSQRVLDYCSVDSQGAAGLFFSMGSRQLSSRFTGSRCVILLNGFKTIVQQIHRESLGISSQRVLDYCPVDSQGVAGLFFSTVSTLLSSRFTGSRWVILLNGLQTIVQQISTVSCWVILLNWFQTIVKQIHRESLGYSSKRVQDYCPVDSEGVAWLYSSTGCRLLSSRFTGSRWVIFLNGFKTIVQQMNRESLGYSSQRILDYCPVDIHRESLGYSSQRVLDYCQQIHRESPGYSSQRVLDYCSVDSQGAAGLFFSMGSRQLSSRFRGSRCVILLNGFQTIVQQIHRQSLGYSSQRVLDYYQVDSQ